MATDKREYKIFVIEDNPGDFALVEDFLFEQIVAPKIRHAMTYQSALEALAVNKFDVILLDLSLPDKTGESLIEGIIEICKNTPVIVLTGYVDFSFGVRSISLGISDYILKENLTPMSLYKSIIYSVERKKNISDLEQSEKRYSDLFNLSPLPMYVIDLDSLKFLDVNNATIIHYGFSKDEFSKMTLKDIRPAEEIPHLYRGLEEDKLNPKENSRRILVHKKKNGDIINVEVQIAPVQYKGKNATIVIANDITERLKYIEAIEHQNEKLREISWIQSHIVRAPLSRIMGLVPLVRDLCDSLDEREKVLEYISISANELDEIIKKITDKSKIEDFQPLMDKIRNL